MRAPYGLLPLTPALWLALAGGRMNGHRVAYRSLAETVDATAAAAPRVVLTAPLTYFQDNCSRCHGEEGAFYDKPALARRADAQLRQSIQEMAEGPGNAPLDGEGVAVQMAYHRAIAAEKPFLAVTKWGGALLEGEATPGSRVWLELGAAKIAAEQSGRQWKMVVPANTDWTKSRLHAALDGQEVGLAPAAQNYSGAAG